VTYVDGENLARTILEKAIRKAAGRGSDVEGSLAFATDREMFERSFKLDPAASDIPAAGMHGNLVLFLNGIRSLGSDAPVDTHFASHNGCLCLPTGRKESALHKRLIEPNRFGHDYLAAEPTAADLRVSVITIGITSCKISNASSSWRRETASGGIKITVLRMLRVSRPFSRAA
jgi:hypothetical protein